MIPKNKLKPGDILLYRVTKNSGFSARFIAWGQRLIGQSPTKHDNYCHIAVMDTDTDYILEAKWPKVRRWKLDWEKLDSHYDVEHWRVKKISKAKLATMLAWATSKIGEWYDLPLFLWGAFNFKNAEVCSTYVQHAFEAVNIELSVEGPGKKLTTPDEIAANTDVLRKVK